MFAHGNELSVSWKESFLSFFVLFFFFNGETNISRILECRHETVICYSFIQFLLCDVVVDAQTMALEHVVVCLN